MKALAVVILKAEEIIKSSDEAISIGEAVKAAILSTRATKDCYFPATRLLMVPKISFNWAKGVLQPKVPDKLEALSEKHVVLKLNEKAYLCEFVVERYSQDNSPAIKLVVVSDRELFCTLTTCIPGTILKKNEILVKTWSENASIAEQLLQFKMFTDTGKRVSTGFVEASIWTVRWWENCQ